MTAAELRRSAEADLVERTRYYRRVGGEELGTRFFDAALESLRALEQMPGVGSPLFAELYGIPGLRVRRVSGFPCGWLYFVAPNHVDVVRLLADAQDLPSIDFDGE